MKVSDIEVTPLHPERWGNDLDVVNAARVSFKKVSRFEVGNEFFYTPVGWAEFDSDRLTLRESHKVKQVLSEKDEKLIRYLAKHKHTSPFNHSYISMRLKAPIFVARQLVKHKFMPWNEVSRRYVDDEPEFYFPDYWRKKADNVKQGSSDDKFEWRPGAWGKIEEAYTRLIFEYNHNSELCPEQARMLLPQNMMTEWIWSGTLGAYCDMLRLRLDPHTQYESRIVAQKIREHVESVFPVSVKALLDA